MAQREFHSSSEIGAAVAGTGFMAGAHVEALTFAARCRSRLDVGRKHLVDR